MAVSTLLELLDEEHPSSSRALLEYTLRGREIVELTARIRRLEEQQGEAERWPGAEVA